MPLQHLGRGPLGGAVEAVDADIGGGVDGVLDPGAVFPAREAVLRRKQRGDLHARLPHDVDIAAALAVETGVVGDQPDALALEGREFLIFEHVEPGLGGSVARHFAPRARAAQGLVVAGERDALRVDSERRRHDGRHLAAQRREGRPRVGMHAVGQQDDVRLARRVDPDGGAGEAGVAVGADGEQVAAIAGERRIDVPAQAAQDRLVGRALRLGELLDGHRAEHAHAVQLAAVEHHLCEARQVVGSGEHSRVAGNAAHIARGGVMHHAAQRRLVFGQLLGGRDARHQRGRRLEHRVLHTERLEDVLARVIRDHLAAQAVHELAQQDEIDVAVDEPRARGSGGRIGVGQLDAVLVAGPRNLERHVRLQAREVRHQVADGDVAVAALELRNVLGDLVVQPELALFEQLHQRRRGGHDLGERGAVEDRIDGHRFELRNDRPVAVGLAVNHLSVVPDDQDRARQPSLLDGVVYGRIEGGAGRKGLRAHCGHSEGRAPEKLHIVL